MSNHKAIVAKIDAVTEIPGATNIHIAHVLGEQVIVSKDNGVGYVGLFFPADLQLSEDYCKYNNLYRDKSKNSSQEKSGFFDENRRVRVQPFLKVKSQGYFAPLSSLNFISDCPTMALGQSFDEVNEIKICEKYISKATREAIAKQNRPKQAKKNYAPYFEKHVDSDQFKHNAGLIPKGALLHFHAKVHGTSHRSGYTLITKELPKWKQFVNKFVPLFKTEDWGYVVGTRNVVLKAGEEKEGFHGSEQFRFDVAESLKPHLEKGMVVYGEIAGYVNGKPIMGVVNSKDTKDKAFNKKYGDQIVYKYGCKEHEYRFHIYRITYLTPEGKNVDFTQAQLDFWCNSKGILGPVEVHPPMIYDGDELNLRILVENLTERAEVLGEDYIDPSHNSEGIIIRVDTGNMTPKFYKSKAYHFRVMEGIAEAVDTEDAA